MLTDGDLQARLTAAFREQADPVAASSVRTAGLYRRAMRFRRRRRAAASFVSAAVAVAVVAVLVAAGLAGRRAAPATAGPAAGMPRFYVTIAKNRPVAEIRASSTGQVLGRVALPAGSSGNADSAIAAAADDRTYVLALTGHFYRLRIAADGGTGQLSALNVPPLTARQYTGDIALSPDGRMLAVSIRHPGRPWAVEIVSLGTGAVRTWSSSGGEAGSLSWADGDRKLAIFWASPDNATPAGLRLLNPAAPGRSLLSARIILPQLLGKYLVQSAVITPDGRSVIASVGLADIRRLSLNTITGGLIELPVRTGVRASGPRRTLLVLHAQRSATTVFVSSCTIASVDATGEHILAQCDHWGRIDHGAFTALPGLADQTPLPAAW
jgi:hypothetical protein